MGGILSGMFTPTEAAGVTVVYAVLVGVFVYRKLKWSSFPKVLLQAGLESGMVMLLIAISEPFAWIVAADQIPQILIDWISKLTTSPYAILLLINIFLLLLGIPIETAPGIVIVTPVLAPIAATMGIDPVHIGIVICLNLVLGLVTTAGGRCAVRGLRGRQHLHRQAGQGRLEAVLCSADRAGHRDLCALDQHLAAENPHGVLTTSLILDAGFSILDKTTKYKDRGNSWPILKNPAVRCAPRR